MQAARFGYILALILNHFICFSINTLYCIKFQIHIFICFRVITPQIRSCSRFIDTSISLTSDISPIWLPMLANPIISANIFATQLLHHDAPNIDVQHNINIFFGTLTSNINVCGANGRNAAQFGDRSVWWVHTSFQTTPKRFELRRRSPNRDLSAMNSPRLGIYTHTHIWRPYGRIAIYFSRVFVNEHFGMSMYMTMQNNYQR